MKANFKAIICVVLLVAVFIIGAAIWTNTGIKSTEIEKLSELEALFQKDDEAVTSLVINTDGEVYVTTLPVETNIGTGDKTLVKDDSKLKTYYYQLAFVNADVCDKIIGWATDPTTNQYVEHLEFYDTEIRQVSWVNYLVAYLPNILIIVLIVVFAIIMINQTNGRGGKMNSFSRAHAKVSMNDKNAVKFADVAGADEEKAELQEVVEFLKNPEKFIKLGARIPRGVLLVGPPGTGKTLLAKAVAGEAGVPFYSISGSDFVEMYVGVGASRVRDLFETARKSPASIIFIDEIDAVGRQRGAGLGGGHDEREQTLNQLLVEMDGFGTHEGIIVMAATNRPDILDSALLRPGRFDRQITVNYPDMRGREAILQVHSRNKPLEGDVDLEKIARTTVGFTGADLSNLMNEAALLAARKNKSLIGMQDLEEALLRVILGPQKKSKERRAQDIRLAAYHEAGHAVVSYYCKHSDPVTHITIIPAGQTGGVTVYSPTEDRMGATKGQMTDRITSALGGRAAEQLVLDDISTGASNDIQQATSVARSMVMRYGMSEKLGTVLYGSEHSEAEVFLGRDFGTSKNYSENTASAIDEEIRRLVDNGYAKAIEILQAHMDKLTFVAEYLIKHESMDGKQFKAAMENEATEEEILAMERDRRERSDAENKNAEKEAAEKAAREQAESQEAEAPKAEESKKDDNADSGNIFKL